jgi:hypothetical protein
MFVEIWVLGWGTTEIFEKLRQVYRKEVMSRAHVLEWCKQFSEGLHEVESDSRPGRSTTTKSDENIE